MRVPSPEVRKQICETLIKFYCELPDKQDVQCKFLLIQKFTLFPAIHYRCCLLSHLPVFSKTCLKRILKKKPKIGFQDRLSLDAGQKYCRMLQWEHSAMLSTFIKLPFAIKTF